ncbi:hypothetical protein Tco_1453015 [Tanacetum coccineum]
MAGVYSVPLQGAYNPPGYAQPQYDQYYQQYPPQPPQYPPQYQQQQDDDEYFLELRFECDCKCLIRCYDCVFIVCLLFWSIGIDLKLYECAGDLLILELVLEIFMRPQ